jgi:4-nitrophenyl phosphatase
MSGNCLAPRFRNKKLFILDMDGTIYLENQLFPWTPRFLEAVAEAGATAMFLTNNSSHTGQEYVHRLAGMNLDIMRDRILTSADATIALLRKEQPGARVFVLAPPAVQEEFAAAGLILDEEAPDILVLAYDTSLTYDRLRRFALQVRKELPYLATHPDINCPSQAGPIPDSGAFMACIKASTGRDPDRIIGKPNAGIFEAAMHLCQAAPDDTIMIGDRLYTDIAGGLAAGIDTCLVLSGESTSQMVAQSPYKPTWVFPDLSSFVVAKK